MHTFAHVHRDQIKLLSVFFYNSLSYSFEKRYLTEPGVCVFLPLGWLLTTPAVLLWTFSSLQC